MGYSFRYLSLHSLIIFFCLNKKNALIPWIVEVTERNEEGNNSLRINDSLPPAINEVQ